MFFFLISIAPPLIFYLPTDSHHHLARKTGPNDARRVVWAISKVSFSFFYFFFHSTNVF
jgi:hypothetical protein